MTGPPPGGCEVCKDAPYPWNCEQCHPCPPKSTRPAPSGTSSTPRRSPEAARIVHALIVEQGMSYADAIACCERAKAPYDEVITELRAALGGKP